MVGKAVQDVEGRAEKRARDREVGLEDHGGKRLRMGGSSEVVPFVIRPMVRNMPVPSDASALKDPEVAFGVATSLSLPCDMEAFQLEPDLNATMLAAQSALLVRILTFPSPKNRASCVF